MGRHKNIDGGYAWVVLAASFFALFLIGAMTYSTGVVNTALLEEIDGDISKTSWVGASLLGTFTLTGPIAGSLTKIFGCRVSCFLGGVLIFLGLVAASFVHDVTGLILTYGIVVGLGMGMTLNSAVVAPGHYFRAKRGVAFGVAISGCGFGMFAGGPLVRYLLARYRLHGCLLILGAIQANTCVAACLLRPSALTLETKELEVEEGTKVSSETSNSKEERDSICTQDKDTGTKTEDVSVEEKTYTKCTESIETDSLMTESCQNHHEREKCESTDPQGDISRAGARSGCFSRTKCSGVSIQGLIQRIRRVTINNKYGFLCYNISVMLWTMGETGCLFHLPNYAETKGSSKTQAASLFTVMGLTSITSRILSGFAGNDSSIGPLIVHIGLLGLEGSITLLFPLFANTYVQQMVFSAVFGLYSGGPNSLMGLLSIELVGLKNLPLGIGVEHFCCGIGFLLGPPLASFVYTASNKYDFTFIFAGALLLLGSFFGLMTGFFGKESQSPSEAVKRV